MEALQILPVFLVLVVSDVALVEAHPFLRLTSDGPVVLDATITFKAELHDVEDYEPPFYFAWSKWQFFRFLSYPCASFFCESLILDNYFAVPTLIFVR